jgi:DNA-binding ferritin-like protein
MAEFADRMKSFTDQLRGSIQMRGEALAEVHAATEGLLDGARTFLGHVADEHRKRADELHATLTSHRTECCQKVAEMRHSHQDSLRKMRGDLHQMLSETRKAREDAVHQMSQTFRDARLDLAKDLRGASDAWREFAASR